ncbi:hypothetical protein ACK3TF_005759 [Chlorella vulgaris]
MPVPIVLLDNEKYIGGAAPLHLLAPGREYGRPDHEINKFEAEFAGRYTAVRLTSKAKKQCHFVAVSYHGRTVGGYLPHEDDCRRYNQPCFDFFCTLWPLNIPDPAGVLVASSVRAHAHLVHAACFDHDPVYCEFLLVTPGLAAGSLPSGIDNDDKVPEVELKLLTRQHLRNALSAKEHKCDGDNPAPTTRKAQERTTLVKLLLLEPQVQYKHLCVSAKQYLGCLKWHGGALLGSSGDGMDITDETHSDEEEHSDEDDEPVTDEHLGSQEEMYRNDSAMVHNGCENKEAAAGSMSGHYIGSMTKVVSVDVLDNVADQSEQKFPEAGEEENAQEIKQLNYRQLQRLCKNLRLPARKKATELLDSLQQMRPQLLELQDRLKQAVHAELEHESYRGLQQLSKAMGLPANKKRSSLQDRLREETNKLPVLMDMMDLLVLPDCTMPPPAGGAPSTPPPCPRPVPRDASPS